LQLLADADQRERTLLGEFKYQPNTALLHTDASVMPKTKLCWASWNYRIDRGADGKISPSTIYWMNSLQGVSDRQNYFVSINGEDSVNPSTSSSVSNMSTRCSAWCHPGAGKIA